LYQSGGFIICITVQKQISGKKTFIKKRRQV